MTDTTSELDRLKGARGAFKGGRYADDVSIPDAQTLGDAVATARTNQTWNYATVLSVYFREQPTDTEEELAADVANHYDLTELGRKTDGRDVVVFYARSEQADRAKEDIPRRVEPTQQ